jgi:hypothetical protein
MYQRYRTFLTASCWASAVLALLYHCRFVFLVDYRAVHSKTLAVQAFYFVTGLGLEAFAIFFVVSGMYAAELLLAHRPRWPPWARYRLAARLFGALLATLALGAALDTAGSAYFDHVGLYSNYPAFSTLTLSWPVFLGNLSMLQAFVMPAFGSNGMLYFLAYACWFSLLAAYAASRRTATLVVVCIGAVAGSALALRMQRDMTLWLAIWLVGVGVVLLGKRSAARPPLPACALALAAALALSRLLGAGTTWLPPPLDAVLSLWKYLAVAAAYGAVALSLYPRPAQHRAGAHRAGQFHHGPPFNAPFLFFFHFPFVMLIGAVISASGKRALMLQPAPASLLVFGLAGAATLILTMLAGRVIGAIAGLDRPQTHPARA